jgi:hypothetical protein
MILSYFLLNLGSPEEETLGSSGSTVYFAQKEMQSSDIAVGI